MHTASMMRAITALLGALGVGLSAQAQTHACGFATGNPILGHVSIVFN